MANESSIFQDLQIKAFRSGVTPRTKEAQKWFRKQVSRMGKMNRWQLMKNEELSEVKRPSPGQMFMFFYNPKLRETLPYYDEFPLIIMIDSAPGGFLGLNLHYLPLNLRARFFDALMDTMNNKKYDETTKLSISYGLLKQVSKMKYFKACIKHYLTDHVESQIVRVEPTEWDIALFMPLQKFKGANLSKVYSESKGKF